MESQIAAARYTGRFGRPLTLMDMIMMHTQEAKLTDECDIDMIFQKILILDQQGVTYDLFRKTTHAHRTGIDLPQPIDPFNGTPYTYVELALWLGESQAVALRYMALGVWCEAFRLLTPRDLLAADQRDDEALVMLLARNGLVAVVHNAPT